MLTSVIIYVYVVLFLRLKHNTMADAAPPPLRGFEGLKAHVQSNKLDAALWLSRVLAIVFTIAYVIPIFG